MTTLSDKQADAFYFAVNQLEALGVYLKNAGADDAAMASIQTINTELRECFEACSLVERPEQEVETYVDLFVKAAAAPGYFKTDVRKKLFEITDAMGLTNDVETQLNEKLVP